MHFVSRLVHFAARYGQNIPFFHGQLSLVSVIAQRYATTGKLIGTACLHDSALELMDGLAMVDAADRPLATSIVDEVLRNIFQGDYAHL